MLTATGTYTLVVSDCSNTNTGNYSIYTQRTNNPSGAVNLPFGVTQAGLVGSTAQSNTYTFSANASDVVDFTMVTTHGALVPKIRLYNPTGALISSANSGGTLGCSGSTLELNTVTLPTTGTYTVLVGDCGDTNPGNYEIYAQRTDNPPGSVGLLFGQVQTGTIGSTAESNTYTFNANASDVVDFTMVITSGTLVPKIQVYNPAGALVSSANSGGTLGCSGSTLELNTVTLPTTGTYTVLLSDCSNTNTGNYSIYTQRTNNATGAANLPYAQTQTGLVGSAAASNTYTFSANASDVVDFTMVTTNGALVPKIRLYNPTGALISSANSGGTLGCSGSTLELNTVTLPTTGTYTVLVGDCGDTNTGNYSIYAQRTKNPTGPTQFFFGGQAQTGTISSAAQSGTYTLGATASDIVDFTVTTTSGALVPKIRLYSPAGALVISANSGGTLGCSGSTVQLNSVTLPATGAYTVLVGDCGDTNTGQYSISGLCFGTCPVTPTVTVTPSPLSITILQALAVTVTVSGGSGAPTATGSVTLTSGSYTSAPTTLSGGGATINIPAGSLAVGTDTLTVSYAPDAASIPGYYPASGSNSVTVTKVTPTVTVTPSPSSITTVQGTMVTVAVSGGSGTPTVTGSVTLTGGGYTSAATTLSSGSAMIVIPAGSLAAGTDTLTVSYTPDASSSPTYNSASGSNTVTVTKLTPTVTVSPSPSSITTVQATTVTVTVSGGGGNPTTTGSVTLTGGGYTSAATTLSSGGAMIVIPAGSLAVGTDTLTVSYTPDAASSPTYNSASGTNSVTVTKVTPTVTVTPSPSSITTVQGTTVTVAVNGGIGAPTATGSVTLTGGGYTSAATMLTSGGATIVIPAGSLLAGTDTLTVSYTPDTTSSPIYNGASGSNSETVTKVTPTVTVSPSPASITTVQATTVTVAVSAGSGTPTATGSVTLTSGSYTSAATTLSSGGAAIVIPAGSLAVGTDTLTVNYTPDAASSPTYNGASGSNSETVTKATPTVTVSPSPSSITTVQATTVTVTVSGGSGTPTATGSVTLTGGGYTSAATTLSSGGAMIVIPAGSLAVGADTLTVSYTPDSTSSPTYNGASGSNSETVTKATPTVTVTPSPASITTVQATTVTVTVSGGSGTPTTTGSVTLTGGGYTSTVTTLSSGGATINIPAGSLAVGADTLTVSYTPDSTSSATYNGASGSNSETVTKATPTVTVMPSQSSITTLQGLTVTVGVSDGSGTPTTTGSVTLTGGGFISAATTLTGGGATIVIPTGSLLAGTDTLTVSYAPDATSSPIYNGASGSNSETVTKVTPTVTVTPSQASITTLQGLTVTVGVSGGSGAPTTTGSVTLSSGSFTSATTTLSSGGAAIVIPAGTLAVGTGTLTVSYTPDATSSPTYNGATGSNTVTVTKVTPTVTVTPSPSSITTLQGTTVTVAVSGGSGTPTTTGSVTLASGSYTSAATTLIGGGATIVIPAGSLLAGTDTVTVGYTPDASSSPTYNSALGSNTVTVTKVTPTVTVTPSPSSITTLQGTTVTVAVSAGSGTPTATGSVTLTGGGYTSAATTLSSGGATIVIPSGSLAAGTDSLTVSYTPDASSSSTYSGASGSNSVTVTKVTPTVIVTLFPSSITSLQTLTATVTVTGGSGTPITTGSVTLTSGGYMSAATILSSGRAVIVVPAGSLANGTDALTVSYTPDASSSPTYSGASVSSSVTVTGPPLTITSLLPASAIAGGSAFTLTVNGISFVPGTTVNFNGSSRITTFVSTTQLTASISASDIASAGWDAITVTNSGGVSNAAGFTVNGGSISPITGSALHYVPVTPCRLVDTRNTPNGPFAGPSVTGGTSRNFTIPQNTTCNIPTTAAAYSLNVAVVPSGPLGFLTLWPAGQAQPEAATVSSVDGRVRSNAAIVPAGTNGAISAYASNTTDLVMDINGYFTTDPTALEFYPVAPCRVVDTRPANGPNGPLAGPSLAGNTSRTFPLPTSPCNLPASAKAYSLNLTAVPQEPLGFLTAWPTGQPQPGTANLSSTTGTVTASAAIVPAGTNGSIDVYASNNTDLVIDVDGYFAPAGTGGLSLYTVPPCRALDTRQLSDAQTTQQPFSGELDTDIQASACGVPSGAQAYVLNATVVPSTPLGFLTLWQQGATQPLAATLSALDQTVTSNLAIVPTTNGSVSTYAANPTQLVLDLFGYFAP